MRPSKKSKPAKKQPAPSIWVYRRPERQLFGWTILCLIIGLLVVQGNLMAQEGDKTLLTPQTFVPFAVFAVGLLLIHLVFLLTRFRGDPLLVGIVGVLTALGVLAQQRMGMMEPEGLWTSLAGLALPLGLAVMLLTALLFRRGRVSWLQAGAWLAGLASLALLAAVLILGQRYRGAVFAPGRMTPTELLKIFVILFAAGYLHQRRPVLQAGGLRAGWALLPLGLFWGLLAALLVLQRDLGLFVILTGVLVLMLYAATGHVRYLLLSVLGAGGFGFIAFRFFLHGQRRILAWQDPFADATGAGWQVLQALSGMYAGGLFGAGIGQGNPERIPIAASDFVYAVIGEELGFVGCAFVVLLYVALIFRGIRVAQRQTDSFSMLLGVGLIGVIGLQAFLNMGGVVKLLPVTGITLPFISHGGSSLLTGFVSIGLLLALSEAPPRKRTSKKPPPRKRKKKA